MAQITQVITAAPGTSGDVIDFILRTDGLTIVNLSPAYGLEYSTDRITWTYLGKKVGAQLEINLASTRVYFRRVDDGSTSVSVDLAPDYTPVSAAAGPSLGNRLGLAGDSLTAFGGSPINATATANDRVVTVTAANHGLVVGRPVIFHLSTTQTAYNGAWKVASVIDKDTFTYVSKVAPTGPSGAGCTIITSRGTTSAAWWFWMNYFLNGAFDIVVNAGVGSNTSTMLLARLDDIIAYRLDYCTVLIGTNDIRYAVSTAAGLGLGAPEQAAAALAAREQAFENIKQICLRLLAEGTTPILSTLIPTAGTEASFAVAMPQFIAINDQIRTLALQNRGIILVDSFAEIVDNSATDNRAVDGYLQTDKVHIRSEGAIRMGRAAANAVRPFMPVPRPLIGSNADAKAYSPNSSNRLNNPLLVRSGGTASTGVTGGASGVAENWQATNSGTATSTVSLVDRTIAVHGDNYGKNQRVVMVAAAAGDTSILRTTPVITDFTEGDDFYCDFYFAASAGTNVQYVLMNCQLTIGGQAYPININAGSGLGFPVAEMPFSGVVRTQDFRLPPGAVTGCQLTITAGFTGAGGVTIEVGRVRLGTKPRLA